MRPHFDIIATLNYQLLNDDKLIELVNNGATIFRINGSHVLPNQIVDFVKPIRSALGRKVKILVDLPGNKIRTAVLPQPIRLEKNGEFELSKSQLNYPPFLSFLKKGDILLANDSLFKFEVLHSNSEKCRLKSFSEGLLTSNKGVHLTSPYPALPILFDRDKDLINACKNEGVDLVGLSFVRTPEDIKTVTDFIGTANLGLMVKVETREAVQNLDKIIEMADMFLVDRGDLSCDIGLEKVPDAQNYVLQKVKEKKKKILFATQFFFSMLEKSTPLISEVCAFAESVRNGVSGIQLSEETAIGRHPIETLQLISQIRNVVPASREPRVYWMTGRSGAGKSTVGYAAVEKLKKLGHTSVTIIDGDEFRGFWKDDTGYSREDRIKNQRNMIFTAFQCTKNFQTVIVSSLSPYREIRALARERLPGFVEVFVNASQQACFERDPKGHYKKAQSGGHTHFVGVTEDYEAPDSPDLLIETEKFSKEECVDQLVSHILKT